MSAASARRPVTPVRAQAILDDRLVDRPERLVTEEPMEIRLQGAGRPAEAIAVTMRTPGHDFELAAGFCRHEGMATPSSIRGIAYCTDVDLTPEQEDLLRQYATQRGDEVAAADPGLLSRIRSAFR